MLWKIRFNLLKTKTIKDYVTNFFDVKSLFKNIPLTETIDLCVKNVYRKQTHIDSLSKTSFDSSLIMKMFESFFIFDQKCYKNAIVLWWVLHRVQHWLMSSCAILSYKSSCKIIWFSLNLLLIEGTPRKFLLFPSTDKVEKF